MITIYGAENRLGRMVPGYSTEVKIPRVYFVFSGILYFHLVFKAVISFWVLDRNLSYLAGQKSQSNDISVWNDSC